MESFSTESRAVLTAHNESTDDSTVSRNQSPVDTVRCTNRGLADGQMTVISGDEHVTFH